MLILSVYVISNQIVISLFPAGKKTLYWKKEMLSFVFVFVSAFVNSVIFTIWHDEQFYCLKTRGTT